MQRPDGPQTVALEKDLSMVKTLKITRKSAPTRMGTGGSIGRRGSSGCLAFNRFKLSHCWVQYQNMLETDIILLLLHYTDTLKHFINSIS